MAQRKKSIGKQRATFQLFTDNEPMPVGKAIFYGSSWRDAMRIGKKHLRNLRKKVRTLHGGWGPAWRVWIPPALRTGV